MHFLHSAGFASETNRIGYYLMRLADGRDEKMPVVVRKEVLTMNPVVAWSGQNGWTRPSKSSIQLFKSTWENPRPEVKITSLDFVSEMKEGAPFLIAITAEP